MRVLCNDISRQEQAVEMPEWHKQLLDARERLLSEGTAQFVDREEAQRQIDEAVQ